MNSYAIVNKEKLLLLKITNNIKIERAITSLMNRDGGKWWSKDQHLVVIKMPKNVDYLLKNVEKWRKKSSILFC